MKYQNIALTMKITKQQIYVWAVLLNCKFTYKQCCAFMSTLLICIRAVLLHNRSYMNKQFHALPSYQNRSYVNEQFWIFTKLLVYIQAVFRTNSVFIKMAFFYICRLNLHTIIFLAVLTPFRKNIDWFLYSFYLYFWANKLNYERRLKFEVL